MAPSRPPKPCPSAPAPAPWDDTDRVLALYFRRAVHAAALGSLCAASAGCGDDAVVVADLPDVSLRDAGSDASLARPTGPLVFDASVPRSTGTPPDSCPRPASDFYDYPRYVCDAQGRVELGLDPALLEPPADYVAFRDVRVMWQDWVGGRAGEACATATDKSACNLALAALCATESCIVTTRGDRVEAWTTTEQVRRLLGSITSPGEALALLLRSEDLPPNCLWPGDVGYRALADGYALQILATLASPPIGVSSYARYEVTRDGTLTQRGTAGGPPITCPGGRRPPGLVAPAAVGRGSALGRYLAGLAHLEAASVPAFARLQRELTVLAAPAPMLAKVRQAIRDERDHAARVAAQARRFGQPVETPRVVAHPLRSAEALALDNVVEGCVRESFGAALATFQAAHAQDAALRATFVRIARDETRHAALAFQIQAWLEPRLSRAARAQAKVARAAAIAALRCELAQPLEAELIAPLGLPAPRQAQALLEQVVALS